MHLKFILDLILGLTLKQQERLNNYLYFLIWDRGRLAKALKKTGDTHVKTKG